MPRRPFDTLRPIRLIPHFLTHPEGSVLIEWGSTKVICTASVENKVPPWLQNKGRGWVTAEYDMLPRSTSTRSQRDSRKGKINSRAQEISRLIGRSLRAVTDMQAFGEKTIAVDCDVIQADGGTRTASITGAFVALGLAFKHLQNHNKIKTWPLTDHVAAVSVGIVESQTYLDLDYQLDVNADVDMNIVMTGNGKLVEVQGTAERQSFDRTELDTLLNLAFSCLPGLLDLQRKALDTPIADPLVTVNIS